MQFTRKFKFDAAHTLMKDFGKKETQLHGHTYGLEITIEGQVKNGRVVDLNKLREIVQEEVIEILDHSYLNDHIDVPSAENIAVWTWNKLEGKLEGLYEIKVYETESHWVTYRGNEGKNNEEKLKRD
ncbi:6-carboxytetrahydropterin synthase [Candidatus Pacearchaeota archaeon]|nr:6-carboxytetrahydropterin synthase [Candidatus Pacearchaeota archaeon]